jgi:hypothetical protein
VVRFTNAAEGEISIVGRTKQYLSLCGEHMSVDNMTKAIENTGKELGITIREFMVAGMPFETLFAHQWYIGCDDTDADAEAICNAIDKTLGEINDDYAVERTSALKRIFVKILPSAIFYDYMRSKGKEGAMNKFPRVMKGAQLEDWKTYVEARGY